MAPCIFFLLQLAIGPYLPVERYYWLPDGFDVSNDSNDELFQHLNSRNRAVQEATWKVLKHRTNQDPSLAVRYIEFKKHRYVNFYASSEYWYAIDVLLESNPKVAIPYLIEVAKLDKGSLHTYRSGVTEIDYYYRDEVNERMLRYGLAPTSVTD